MTLCTSSLFFLSLLFTDCSFAGTKTAILFRNADRVNILPSYFRCPTFTEMVTAGLTTVQGEVEIFEKGVLIRQKLEPFFKKLDSSKDVIVSATHPDRSLKSAVLMYSGMFHYNIITTPSIVHTAYQFAEMSLPSSIISDVQTIPDFNILMQAFSNVEQKEKANNGSFIADAQSFIKQLYDMEILAPSAVDHPFDLTEAEFIIAEIVATKGRPNSKLVVPPNLLNDLSVHLHEYLIRSIEEVAVLYGGRDVVCSHIQDAIQLLQKSRFSLAILSFQDYNMYVVRLCYGQLESYPLPGKGYILSVNDKDGVVVNSI